MPITEPLIHSPNALGGVDERLFYFVPSKRGHMNQTMTIKELAEVAGCSVKTVNRLVKEFYPSLIKNGRTTRFTKEEAFDIIAKLPKKNDLGQPRTKVGKVGQGVDAKFISQIVAETIKQLIPYLQPTKAFGGQFTELPPVNLRSELNAIVKSYAVRNDILFPFAWEYFFQRAKVRLRVDITTCAKNRGIDRLDYAEENGYMELLYELAKAEFK